MQTQDTISSMIRKGSAVFAVALLITGVPVARADVVGVYVGGAFGQGRIDTGNQTAPTAPPLVPAPANIGSFTENHAAYKLVAGVRAIALVGAEIEYLDLGHPSRGFSFPGVVGSADVKMNGGGAFGMLYLPVPVVTVYLKGGLARLKATSNVTVFLPGVGTCPINNPNCARFTRGSSTTNTSIAAGAGVQVKLGPIALRAEYERFNAAGGNPGLTSVGAFWNF